MFDDYLTTDKDNYASLWKRSLALRKGALTVAPLLMCISLYAGCSSGSSRPQEAPAPAAPRADDRVPPPSSSPMAKGNQISIDGSALKKFDDIVNQVGSKSAAILLKNTIEMLSEGHRPPQKSARMRSNLGDFSGRDKVKSEGGACDIAVVGGSVEFESAGDGTNARMVSVPIGSVAKVYCDLTLSNSIVVPRGTLLRRETSSWVGFNDPEFEKRLDSFK